EIEPFAEHRLDEAAMRIVPAAHVAVDTDAHELAGLRRGVKREHRRLRGAGLNAIADLRARRQVVEREAMNAPGSARDAVIERVTGSPLEHGLEVAVGLDADRR